MMSDVTFSYRDPTWLSDGQRSSYDVKTWLEYLTYRPVPAGASYIYYATYQRLYFECIPVSIINKSLLLSYPDKKTIYIYCFWCSPTPYTILLSLYLAVFTFSANYMLEGSPEYTCNWKHSLMV